MENTPKGLRRHIVIVGRRNAGKSSLMNSLARQQVAIVADRAGTTTDPVEKTMELAPLGPVVLIDTAGVDDLGELGAKRIDRTYVMLERADTAILVTDGDEWHEAERELAGRLRKTAIPWLIARNKCENGLVSQAEWRKLADIGEAVPVVDVSALTGAGMSALVSALADLAAADENRQLLADLLPPGGVAVLVVPLDSGAPKGRLILPQVQAIRDCLDGQRFSLVCTEKEYVEVYQKLAAAPDLVVCDSQVVAEVAQATPPAVPLTTFSILMARFKGDLAGFAQGAAAVARLCPGDAVLIEEACSHHAQKDDIGRVKIPRLLEKMAGGSLEIRHSQGKDGSGYAPDLKAVIHCGACVLTRTQMRGRQERAGAVPMTNYGMTISLAQGLLPRVLAVFPEALAAFEAAR